MKCSAHITSQEKRFISVIGGCTPIGFTVRLDSIGGAHVEEGSRGELGSREWPGPTWFL